MSYRREVPRDLFNEGNLLKCLGMISVSILDNKFYKYGLKDELNDFGEGFVIEQTESGDTYCSNYFVYDPEGENIPLYRPLNSRSPWPLLFVNKFEDSLDDVFNDDGTFSQEFFDYLDQF